MFQEGNNRRVVIRVPSGNTFIEKPRSNTDIGWEEETGDK